MSVQRGTRNAERRGVLGLRGAFVGVLALSVLWIAAGMASAATEKFRRDVQALTAGSHRLTGTPEGQAAARYVEGRLKEIPRDKVIVTL